jgi:hypothetical protein
MREASCEDEAQELIFEAQVPVVFRGLARDWPCVQQWGDLEALKARVGHHVVPVEVGNSYMDPGLRQLEVSMGDVLTFVQRFDQRHPREEGVPQVQFTHT